MNLQIIAHSSYAGDQCWCPFKFTNPFLNFLYFCQGIWKLEMDMVCLGEVLIMVLRYIILELLVRIFPIFQLLPLHLLDPLLRHHQKEKILMARKQTKIMQTLMVSLDRSQWVKIYLNI